MQRYTPEEREFIVNAYLKNSRSIVLAQREFRRLYPLRTPPCPRTVKRLAERLELTGSTEDIPRSGRPRIARSLENIAAVAEDVKISPEASTRHRSTKLGISRRSLRRILIKDLNMVPCQVESLPEKYAESEGSKQMKKIVANGQEFSCENCDRNFVSEELLQRHMEACDIEIKRDI